MGRQVHIYFETSTTLRRNLSEKLIRRVRSSSLPTKFEQETAEVMKPGCFLPFAAAVCAVASSGDAAAAAADEKQVGLDGRVFPVRDGVLSSLDWVVDSIGGGIVQVAGAVTRTARSLSWSKADVGVERDGALGRDRRRSVTEREDALESVWEAVRESKNGRRFADLVNGHEKLRKLLTGSDGVTVFLPTDEAFAKLDGLERSDEELMEEILQYHVLSAEYTIDELRRVQTASSVLEESNMGRRQRVRVEGSSSGITVNFYSRVLDGGSKAVNGIVHFVDNVLVPPPRHDKLINALPEQLGTFSRAMTNTGVSEELHARAHGITLFTPSNEAWEALGAEVNTFLFSDEGLEYLRALARYHVLDKVVYSDLRLSDDARDEEMPSTQQFQTLLGDAVVSVGINREKPVMVVNGHNVSVRDMSARDGVVHVLDEVLIPSSTGSNVSGGGRPGVEELKRLLGPFVQAEGFASNEL